MRKTINSVLCINPRSGLSLRATQHDGRDTAQRLHASLCLLLGENLIKLIENLLPTSLGETKDSSHSMFPSEIQIEVIYKTAKSKAVQ